jgi:hypothetical protein
MDYNTMLRTRGEVQPNKLSYAGNLTPFPAFPKIKNQILGKELTWSTINCPQRA